MMELNKKVFLLILILYLNVYVGLTQNHTLNSTILTNVHSKNITSSTTLLHDNSSCVPNQYEHPINVTASCKETRFPIQFENFTDFAAAIEFEAQSCTGRVDLNITLNDECKIMLTKVDVLDGSAIVVNKENHNLISGNRVTLTLHEDNLSVQGPNRQFQIKAGCKLAEKHKSVQLDTLIQNSNPLCKAFVSLDANAKFYTSPTIIQVLKSNIGFFVVASIVILVCIILLILMLCLWRLNSLPGTRFVSSKTGKYTPKSIEDTFSNAYPVHFQPTEEPVTRSSQTIEVRSFPPAVTIEKFEPDQQQLKL